MGTYLIKVKDFRGSEYPLVVQAATWGAAVELGEAIADSGAGYTFHYDVYTLEE